MPNLAPAAPGGTDGIRYACSPRARYSPLPGWWMPDQPGEQFPTRGHVRQYLADYEARYELPVQRPAEVTAVTAHSDAMQVHTSDGTVWRARAVISATGTWRRPYWPRYPTADRFTGTQLHTVSYQRPEPFAGQQVIVVGGGNSAAQILAEVSAVANATWVTLRPPRFLPDDVDGRVLFDVSTRRQIALRAGHSDPGGVTALGDIVITLGVRAGRDRGALARRPMFDRLTPTGVAWADGREQAADTIIWCTGFRPDLDHLAPLALDRTDGIPRTAGTRSVDEPRLHLLGYGDWTGAASATLIGAARTAKGCVTELLHHLRAGSPAR